MRTTPENEGQILTLRISRITVGAGELRVASVPCEPPSWPSALSPSEREVARCLIRGWSHACIAAERGVTTDTVSAHVSSMIRKLNVDSVHRLVATLADPRIR